MSGRLHRRAGARPAWRASPAAGSGVDIDEDGKPNGQVRLSDLTPDLATMPAVG
jgi:hypothetical protein